MYKRSLKITCLSIVTLIMGLVMAPNAFGQDTYTGDYSEDIYTEIIEETEIIIDSTTEIPPMPSTTGVTLDASLYMPYAKFVNYQYQGDGSVFSTQDIIMEYTPDSQGIFQIASFTGKSATAYIYQITSAGLYELAMFEDYNIVEDLRYSPDAMDEQKSLVLPSKLTTGASYQSGYNNEKKRTVIEVYESFSFGGYTFQNVVKIQEGDQVPFYYYYLAPEFGLILVERVNEQDITDKIIQLISTQGNVLEY